MDKITKIPAMFGRLGTKADLNKQVKMAKSFGGKVTKEKETVVATINFGGNIETLFKAICKGGSTWLIMYNRKFYPQD